AMLHVDLHLHAGQFPNGQVAVLYAEERFLCGDAFDLYIPVLGGQSKRASRELPGIQISVLDVEFELSFYIADFHIPVPRRYVRVEGRGHLDEDVDGATPAAAPKVAPGIRRDLDSIAGFLHLKVEMLVEGSCAIAHISGQHHAYARFAARSRPDEDIAMRVVDEEALARTDRKALVDHYLIGEVRLPMVRMLKAALRRIDSIIPEVPGRGIRGNPCSIGRSVSIPPGPHGDGDGECNKKKAKRTVSADHRGSHWVTGSAEWTLRNRDTTFDYETFFRELRWCLCRRSFLSDRRSMWRGI